MNERSVLIDLFLQFAFLSCIAIGGIIAVVPEMHTAVVERHQWMTSQTFVTLFALSQAAPGPNVIVVTLVGWKVAGAAGAAVATFAAAAPSFAMAYAASKIWRRVRTLDWYRLFERGIAPVTIGLVLSSGVLLAEVAVTNAVAALLTLGTGAAVLRWRNSPLIALAIAAMAGFLGLV